MITSSNPTILGSENCPPVIHRKYSCGTPDFLITAMELDHDTGTLTIYQNPNNCTSITIDELLKSNSVSDKISDLINNKVDKSYFLHTTNGLQEGGTFESELTLSIKGNDAHIDATPSGLKIKKFTEVSTSGTVPSPISGKNTEEHFLNAKGEWTKLGVLQFKGTLSSSTNIPTANLDNGDMYIIADLVDPTKTITVNGKTFFSTDVIVWNGTEFIDVGQVSVKVNLELERNATTNTVTNTAGEGITLKGAGVDGQYAGLMTASDKSNLDTLTSRKVVTDISQPTAGTTEVTFDYYSQKNGEVLSTSTIKIPDATKATAGVMTAADKTKLDNMAGASAVVTNVSGTSANDKFVIKVTKSGAEDSTFNIPLVGDTNAGLISADNNKIINKLTDSYLQSDWDATSGAALIKSKPTIISRNDRSNSRGYLVPPSNGNNDENIVLNCFGEWVKVKSSPDIYVQSTEPSGSNIGDGTIWIQT